MSCAPLLGGASAQLKRRVRAIKVLVGTAGGLGVPLAGEVGICKVAEPTVVKGVAVLALQAHVDGVVDVAHQTAQGSVVLLGPARDALSQGLYGSQEVEASHACAVENPHQDPQGNVAQNTRSFVVGDGVLGLHKEIPPP